MGLRVCKWLRSQLIVCSSKLMLQPAKVPEVAVTPSAVVRTLAQFRHGNVMLHWHEGEGGALIAGLVAAVSCGCATGLKQLNMSRSCLSPQVVEMLLSALGRCDSIETLELHSTQLNPSVAVSLGKMVGQARGLLRLNIGGNPHLGDRGGEALARAYWDVPELRLQGQITHLDLSRCQIGDIGMQHLASVIAHNVELTSINLERNSFGFAGATSLARALAACTNLRILNVGRNDLEEAGVVALAETIAALGSLSHLHLQGSCEAGSAGSPALGDALKRSSSLQLLDLSGATFTEAPQELLDGLASCKQLRRLLLGYCSLVRRLPLRGLKSCALLTELDLHGLRLGGQSAAELAEVLPTMRHLDTLILGRNSFGQNTGTGPDGNLDGPRMLSTAIGECQALCNLDVSRSGLNVSDLDLSNCTRLLSLGLGFCSMRGRDDGWMASAGRWLTALTSLSILDLPRNPLGDDGATVLAAAIGHCRGLEALDLRFCSIGDAGATALASTIPHLSALSELRLENNKIGDEGAFRLAGGAVQCPSLTEFVVDGNPMGAGAGIVLSELVLHRAQSAER